MEVAKRWIRSLTARHGRLTVIALVAILAVGFGARAYRVAEPLATPGDDSRAYYALAKSLYEEGSFGGRGFRDPSDWSPGAPLVYAAAFYATGGAREGTARIVELIFGVAAILVVYLLGRRLGSRRGGLIAPLGVAVYPPFIHSTGALFSEPIAIFTLPAAVLAFLWAAGLGRGDPTGGSGQPELAPIAWRFLLPGLLLGATAMMRPEYLLVGLAFVALAPALSWRRRGWKPGVAAAVLLAIGLVLPIAPWTVRNAIVLERVVPISTGSGKALYVGTLLPADGEYQRAKALLLERQRGIRFEPGSAALDRVDPRPLFDRVASRYPELRRDAALGRIGKENFSRYLGDDPGGYAAMTVRKVWRMWSAGIGEAMSSPLGRVVQVAIVLAGLGGAVLLGRRREWMELIVLATPLALITAIGAATLAPPRRNEVLMTLIFPLAGLALTRLAAAISSSPRWRPKPASSRPS